MSGGPNRVFVVVGDGELNEGSVWEAALVAAAQRLDNLVVIVDRNEFQANVRTEDLVPLEPLEAKFAAFGWATARINGHDFDDMERCFARLPFERGRPSVVIADTIRGKGLASLERRADRWFVAFTDDEATALIEELRGGADAVVNSQPRMVR
jgi:transketolase